MKPIVYIDGKRVRARGIYRWRGERIAWVKRPRDGARVEILRPGYYLGFIYEFPEPEPRYFSVSCGDD